MYKQATYGELILILVDILTTLIAIQSKYMYFTV